jgi:serine/threonine-protein kinase
MTPELSNGQRIGKYLLTEKLGEGGMGVVFGGVHEGLGRPVAIKVLRGEFSRNEMVVTRFQKEAEAVSRIGHSNIVAIYDFGRMEDGSLFYVMERIRGETLRQRFSRPPFLQPEEAVHIFAHVARALGAAHALGIVHRDLKPENVLLEPRDPDLPLVKVLDFGVAKVRDEDALLGGSGSAGPAALTRAGSLLGTPTYMAPEQISASQNVDGRADLYALAAMLYEVLTGEPPFGMGDMRRLLIAHLQEAVVPPSQRARFPFPPSLDPFLLRALAKDPAGRPPDANAFITEMRRAWGLPPEVRAPSVVMAAAPAQPSPPKRKPWWAIGLGLGLLCLGGAGIVAWRMRATATPNQPPSPPVVEDRHPLLITAQQALADLLAGDVQQRRMALEAIGEVADRRSLEYVVEAFADNSPAIRRAAAGAAIQLARPEDQQLRTALGQALRDSSAAVAVDVAAAMLRAGGKEEAEQILLPALKANSPGVRLRVSTALAEAGKIPTAILRQAIEEAPASTPRAQLWAAYVSLYRLNDAAFRAELEAALAGNNPVVKLAAAQTLALARNPKGLLALTALLRDASDPVDRVDAAAVLAKVGDVGAVETLEAALASDRPEIRARAAQSLGRLAESLPDLEPIAAKLKPLLAAAAPQERAAAAAALVSIAPHLSARRTP